MRKNAAKKKVLVALFFVVCVHPQDFRGREKIPGGRY
jgi:hypothetical protein